MQAVPDISRASIEGASEDEEEIYQCDYCSFEGTHEEVLAHEATCTAGEENTTKKMQLAQESGEDSKVGKDMAATCSESNVDMDAEAARKGSSTSNGHASSQAHPISATISEEARLWPNIEARNQWRRYVSDAATFAQLSLAISNLRDHAAAYNTLGKKVDATGRAIATRRCVHVWDVLPPESAPRPAPAAMAVPASMSVPEPAPTNEVIP